ncbi:MAG: hypothetical protein JW957_06300, partial [Candidatus Omnitrophica bacterium]|nr:hypothetical protein [Candidatus Omnitrophota bacterium]
FGIVRTMYKNQYHDQMPRIGAPFDTILLEDLEIAPDYKFYIFMDTFYVTERQRAVIEKKVKRNGNTALWLFGAGYVTDKGLSDAAMKELTGIDIAAYDGGGKMRMTLCDAEHPITRGVMPGIQFETADETGPLFYSRDKDARILGMTNVVPCTNSEGVFKSGSETMPGFVVKEMDNWHSVWCAVPNIPPALLRNMAKEAGVHIYSDGDDVVYANRFIVSVTARYGGERTIKLPKPCMVVDAFTGEVVSEKTGSFNADLKQYETKIWRLEY